MNASLIDKAPAKLNLTLHIRGRRLDGWHDLESLVAFAGAGDLLSLEPADSLSLVVEGLTAAACGPLQSNLVLRAAHALALRVPGLRLGRFVLRKRLPAAAGIGGGSSDAASALRLLARHNGLAIDDPRVFEAAVATGSDVPVCLDPHARMMRGRGEDLGPRLALPRLFAVLVNPGVALETARVFSAVGLQPGEASSFGPHPAMEADTCEGWSAKLRRARNDMEGAACVLAPVIFDTLAALGAAPGAKLARMSGSGATCFALFGDCRAAGRAARLLMRDHPGWWVKATTLR